MKLGLDYMDINSSIVRPPKKKPWLGNPSTTILRDVDVQRHGVFAVVGGSIIGFVFTLNQGEKLVIGSSSKANISTLIA